MHDLIGRTLGQYRIIEQLGKGGMATVFKAFQPSLERYVAIKVLPPYFAHEEGFSERFVREAKAIAKLDHPHILPVYDSGQDGDISYIVMKYVEAGTLKDLDPDRPLSLEKAATIISQTASALDYAHEQGVVHRDIKPANILLDRGEWVLLSDFGLARMVEASQQLTASGVGVGTPAYMAPEQGQGFRVDGRADIYSLGIVLYEMLTGRVPYEAETPLAVVLKHVTEPLQMPRLVNPEIPEAVELVILKALAKNPDDRYQTAGEMATRLCDAAEDARFLCGEAQAGTPSTVPIVRSAEPTLADTVQPVVQEALDQVIPVPATVAGVAPTEQPTIAEALGEPETEQLQTQQATKRRMPWWAYALGAAVIIALLAVGAGFAVGWFAEDNLPTATATVLAVQPTSTPRPTEPPEIKPTEAKPDQPATPKEPLAGEQPFVLGTWVRGTVDLDAAAGPFLEDLSQRMGRPVELVPLDDPFLVAGLMHEGALDAALVRTPYYAWLRDDERIPLLPLLYAEPSLQSALVVRENGPIQELSDLRGRRVAIASWNLWAAIVARAEFIESGFHLEEEAEVIYLSPNFESGLWLETLRMVQSDEADAAIVGLPGLESLAEDEPDRVSGLVILSESRLVPGGILAIRPDLNPQEVRTLHDAILNIPPENLYALTPFTALFDSKEPLENAFARALEVVGLEPWRLIENVPPEEQPVPGGAKPPAPSDLRVVLVSQSGIDPQRDPYVMPVRKALEQSSEELGFQLTVAATPEDVHPLDVALEHVEEGYQVVVAFSWWDTPALHELAVSHPEITVISVGTAPDEIPPNLLGIVYRYRDAGFVAGALAGKAIPSGRVVVLGGMEVDSVMQLVEGFQRGVEYTGCECEAGVEIAGSFGDLELGREFGHAMAEARVFVLFNAAGPLGSAALRAAAANGVWVIGVDVDEYRTTFQDGDVPGADHLLGSVVQRGDRLLASIMKDLVRGHFEPGRLEVGVAEEAIEFVPGREIAHPRVPELEAYIKDVVIAIREGRVQP